MTHKHLLHLLALGSSAILLPAVAMAASPVAVHGSVSATAAISDNYNFLGDTKDSLDLNIVEVTLNSSYRFPNGLRAMAQVYGYKLEGYEKLMIDFANLDWQYNEAFGARLGYVKLPFGFYNEVLDVDSIRPFAFLPTVTYQKTYRPIANNILGLCVYGTTPSSKAGSLEYQAYAGTKDRVNGDTPLFRVLGSTNFLAYDRLKFDAVYGGSLIWNTPLEGFRAVASATFLPGLSINSHVRNAADLSVVPSAYAYLPISFGTSYWNTNLAGTPGYMDVDYNQFRTGLEYTWKDFVFSAEYTRVDTQIDLNSLIAKAHTSGSSDNFYGMVTWQATKEIGLGAYYGESYEDRHDRTPAASPFAPSHVGYTKDLALAFSYAPADWCIFKVENHFYNGTSQIHNRAGWNGTPSSWPKSWNYFVLKSTFTF